MKLWAYFSMQIVSLVIIITLDSYPNSPNILLYWFPQNENTHKARVTASAPTTPLIQSSSPFRLVK